jgi:hypothetical protein
MEGKQKKRFSLCLFGVSSLSHGSPKKRFSLCLCGLDLVKNLTARARSPEGPTERLSLSFPPWAVAVAVDGGGGGGLAVRPPLALGTVV